MYSLNGIPFKNIYIYFRQTDRRTHRWTDGQTNEQTVRLYYTPNFIWGHKNTNVLIMAHMDIKEHGFTIRTLNAGKLLRHVRITSNQQNHFQTRVVKAQYAFVSNILVVGVTTSF